MLYHDMPVGNPSFFEGDLIYLHQDVKDLVGFYEVEVTSPKDLKYPILQTRIKTKHGTRTVAPLGTWTGVYYSEELALAKQYGYTFKILRGCLFKKQNIFEGFIEKLYNIKVNNVPGSPNYIIAKMLMNSLYGRFGMKDILESHRIMTSEEALTYQLNQELYTVTNVIKLNNGKELISFFDLDLWSHTNSRRKLISSATYRFSSYS